MQNPFTLTFGKRPLEPVERPVQTNEILIHLRQNRSINRCLLLQECVVQVKLL